jgi:hypothetical protein
VATEGIANGSPSSFSQAPGRNPGSAADSSRPLPSALATSTLPARTACSRPGTPSAESLRSSSGVAVVVVESAQDRMHTPQAVECFQVDQLATNRQVLPFDERETEVARKIGMLEIGFIVGARRQEHDQRRLAGMRSPMRQRVLKFAEEGSKVLDIQVAELLGKGPSDDGAILKCVTSAGGRLGAIGDYPPLAVG